MTTMHHKINITKVKDVAVAEAMVLRHGLQENLR